MAKKAQLNFIIPAVIFVILLTAGIVASVHYGVFQQSILSASPINIGGGKAYWVISATASSVDEGYTFSYKPNNATIQTTTDNFVAGTKISPSKSMSLSVSKADSGCVYQMTQNYVPLLGGIVKVPYYQLSTPSRIAMIKVDDNRGNVKVIDGTVQQSITFTDSDGKGTLNIETEGVIPQKRDCPSNTNTVIWLGKDNKVIFAEKTDFVAKVNTFGSLSFTAITNWIGFFSDNLAMDTSFIGGFDSAPSMNTERTEVRGGLNIGNVLFTLTADTDYFDSFIYTPPKEVKPKIESIDAPKMIQDTANSVKVIISNQENSNGTMMVEISSPTGSSFTPSKQNIMLQKSATLFFTEKVTVQDISSEDITVKACSVSQFGQFYCDEKTITHELVKPSVIPFITPVKEFCGDGYCNVNENNVTCPQDCLVNPVPPPPVEDVCKKECKFDVFNPNVLLSCEYEKAKCAISAYFYFLKVGASLLVLILTMLLSNFELNKKYLKGDRNKAWRIVTSFLIAVIIASLVFLYWWTIIIILVLYLLIKLGISLFLKR